MFLSISLSLFSFRLRTLRHPSVVTFIEARLPPEVEGNAPPSGNKTKHITDYWGSYHQFQHGMFNLSTTLHNAFFLGTNISPAVATEPVLPLLVHLERLEDEEEEVQDFVDDDDEEAGQNKNVSKRNVSIDNYIAWGILQVIFNNL